jgi:hypothetical protein
MVRWKIKSLKSIKSLNYKINYYIKKQNGEIMRVDLTNQMHHIEEERENYVLIPVSDFNVTQLKFYITLKFPLSVHTSQHTYVSLNYLIVRFAID